MMRKTTDTIVMHCSDSAFGNRDLIDEWHKERGWSMVGYHFVILNGVVRSRAVYTSKFDGKVEVGRELMSIGAHVKGYNNRSIGICLIGKDKFTDKQFIAAKALILDIQVQFNDLRIVGHCELDSNKTCPVFDMNNFRDFIIDTGHEHPKPNKPSHLRSRRSIET